MKDKKFAYFQQKILEHLERLEAQELRSIKKSLREAETLVKAGLPIGTIRTWKGKKFIKIAPNKWRPKYDGESRGAKMAIAALKKKAANCTDSKQLMQLVLENRSRFSDESGRPLPFVQELSDYVSELNNKIERNKRAEENGEMSPADKLRNLLSGWSKKERHEKLILMGEKGGNRGKLARQILKEDFGEIVKMKFSPEAERKRKVRITFNKKKLGAKPAATKEAEAQITPEEIDKNAAAKKDENEARQNRSEAMKGNQNAKKDGDDAKQKGKLKQISEILQKNIEPMPEKIDFTRDNFDKLFKNGIDSPIEHIKIGDHQFEKLEEKGRQGLLAPMADVMKNPALVIKTTDGAKLYVKTYKGEKNAKNIVSVIVDKGDIHVSISTHIERAFQLAKKMDSILFERSESVHGETPHEEQKPQPASTISQPSAKSSGIEKIKAQYEATRSVSGDADEIYVGDKTFQGTWKLVEAAAPSASHNERTFYKTEGFPENADGSTVNDRDYEHDKAAQEAVISVAGKYDGRALSFDSPVVVTQDGVVVSGNNRTMSSKLAASKGTDGAYIEALKKRAKKFGFEAKDLEGFKNPRVVFEIQSDGAYSTQQFAQFNESETKAMNPIETAVKVSKTVKPETVKAAAEVITEFDTMGELYADSKAVGRIFDKFETAGIINRFTRPQYENAGAITGAGKEFLETVLIGSVVNEKNIRGLNREGCKSIRRKLVRAISPLVNNKSMGGYAVTDQLNEAIDVMMQVNIEKDKFKSVSEFAMQQNMFEKQNPVAIELAKKLEGKEKDFADFMQGMNAALEPGASGQVDIFFGGVETKEDVLNRMLGIKKAVAKILTDFLARKMRAA